MQGFVSKRGLKLYVSEAFWGSKLWQGEIFGVNEHQFGNFHFHHIPRAYRLQMILALCFLVFFGSSGSFFRGAYP
jgi:hypothetical protein